jgi:hypothetical protein
MSPRPLAQGHDELMTQHQNLGVLPPRLPPRQAQHRNGPGHDEEDQLQAHKPKIIARQPESDLAARHRSHARAGGVPQHIRPGGGGFRHSQVKDASGKVARQGRGQGFQLDQEAKVAVEAHAMNMAVEFYGETWDVEDVHGTESFDMICRRDDGQVKHVEVKGTTTDGAEVILTPNEISHARDNLRSALFVLSNITVERAEHGTVIATGGTRHSYDPWPG